jgi:putative DNA primase/helicase
MMTAAEIAGRLGLDRHPRSWRGSCPACGYVGTFSVRAGRNGQAVLYCANCQGRDSLTEAVARATGEEPRTAPRADPDEAAKRQRNKDRALSLWKGSESAVRTPADQYLTARGLHALAASPALRFRADAPHPEGGRYPAMIALVSGPAGEALAVHRTYVTRDGRKAAVTPVKASLGPIWGGAIRLGVLDTGRPLVIGGGIETAASAGRLTGLPAWAAISAGNLSKGLGLPREARHVLIAADPDKAGRDAARDAWTRWTAEGREVRIAIPDGDGDFNHLLIARELNHVA